MKYPQPQDNYSCEVICDNFMEVEERLSSLEQTGGVVIPDGSITLNKLAEEIYTQTEVDTKLSEKQPIGEYATTESVTQLRSDLTEHTHTASDVRAVGSITILRDIDVTSIKTEGSYYCNKVTNVPTDSKYGYLRVIPHPDDDTFRVITWQVYNSDIVYTNCLSDGVWSGWSTGFLPLTGGTLSSGLGLCSGKVVITYGNEGAYLQHIPDSSDSNNYSQISVNHSAVLNNRLRLRNTTDGNQKSYNLYGEHNKPSGSYSGNGSATQRTINVGGFGFCIAVQGNGYFGIIGAYGGYCVDLNGDVRTLKQSEAMYLDGVLTIAISGVINGNATYYYQVL